MSPRPERPSDADYYERDRVELFSQGDLFRDVPLAHAQVPARLPGPVRLDRARARRLPRALRLAQPPAPPLRDRPDDAGGRPLRSRQGTPRRTRPRPRRRLRAHPRAVPPPAAATTRAANRRLDQQARHEGGRSLNSNADRLIRLDRRRETASKART